MHTKPSKMDPWALWAAFGAEVGFRTAFWERQGNCSEATLAPPALFLDPFWRPLDFEGLIHSVFLDVFGATAKTKQIMYFLQLYR